MQTVLTRENTADNVASITYGGHAVSTYEAIPFEEFEQAFAYDGDNGTLTWKISPARNVKAGERASVLKGGYLFVGWRGRSIPVQRLAWRFAHGEWPAHQVQFIDGDSINIKLSNLRLGGGYQRKTVAKRREITFEEADKLFSYNRWTGELRWRESPAYHIPAGSLAGGSEDKKKWVDRHGIARAYAYITAGDLQIPKARICWALGHGVPPKPGQNVIFADGDANNFQLSNLRLREESLYETQGSSKLTKAAQRRYGVERHYGKDAPEVVDRLFIEQRGMCAICETAGGHPTGADETGVLHIDHDHETGAVRALLCFKCNSMLGSAGDDPARLRAAADYIERHRTAEILPFPKEGA